jgi:hypothetical protein
MNFRPVQDTAIGEQMNDPEPDTTDHALKMPPELVGALRCPGQSTLTLRRDGAQLIASDDGGTHKFPIVRGTPILINEANSVFRITDFTESEGVTTMDLRDDSVRFNTSVKKLKGIVSFLTPAKSRSISDFTSSDAFDQLLDRLPNARVLVVGAGNSRFENDHDACVVYTDVALAQNTHLIADAHDIPFADNTFDAVFAVAVLQHVADPYSCVTEIQRVLKPGGYIYSLTPFMQQVCMGRYDFTRFTALGHRRLLRWFDEDRSGVAAGPGMAVAWSIEYMLSSMSANRIML